MRQQLGKKPVLMEIENLYDVADHICELHNELKAKDHFTKEDEAQFKLLNHLVHMLGRQDETAGTIRQSDFRYETGCKGKMIGDYKVTNNSNYLVWYGERFVGEVRTKNDALNFIDNLVRHQKLEYTAE